MVRFGQVVVGPPGSGKTTYCLGMHQYMKAIGRDAAVINLDPANHGEGLPYTAAVDIQELVSVEVRAPMARLRLMRNHLACEIAPWSSCTF